MRCANGRDESPPYLTDERKPLRQPSPGQAQRFLWRFLTDKFYRDARARRMTAFRLVLRPMPRFALRTFAAPPLPSLLPA